MLPQHTFSPTDPWERMADHFMFWIYDAIDAPTNAGEAGRAYAEGGLIVNSRGGNPPPYLYSYIFVGKDYSYSDVTFAENLAKNNSARFFGRTRGFLDWVNVAKAKTYSLSS